MKLSKVYARFYKSFNFDYHRKAHREAEPRAWEMIGDLWYPYIEVEIDRRITTVVGANESGKSHLLNAIAKAISGEGFRHQDLCRYCDFFNVARGNDFWPHLGVGWSDVTPEETANIQAALPEAPEEFTSFLMFREGPERLKVYFANATGGYDLVERSGADAKSFGRDFLPRVFRIQSDVALPGALPTAELVEPQQSPIPYEDERGKERGALALLRRYWTGDPAQFAQQIPSAASELGSLLGPPAKLDEKAQKKLRASYDLARKLLLQLADVDPERLVELANFIEGGENGHAAALAESINRQLEKRLNFPKYWVQDRDFQLRVTALESGLVFTIRDRTGTEYTFDERSAGLTYFLSYFIQSQTHVPDEARPEILVMDEPDAYLSAEAQQDLLKILAGFAEPEDGSRPVQVVYVTHSPFLLDKNHAERIRVLEKGKGSDGTRVIKNASQNHYEPLRSAFGAYVGETAFIGACNLLVEGVADQVLLAGISRTIQRNGSASAADSLDLNRVVLVPCGSAQHVPYMLYLVRGRDSEAPAAIVLLDSDASGNTAAAILRKNDKETRRLINPAYVMQFAEFEIVGTTAYPICEPEDLLPIGLAVAAANLYFAEVSEFREGEAAVIAEADVAAALGPKTGMFDALKASAAAQDSHIDKIGFARAVVALCDHENPRADVAIFIDRMKHLFQGINKQRRAADEEKLRHRIKAVVEQHRKIFEQDHPGGAVREQGLFLFERIAEALDHSPEAKAIRDEMGAISAAFGLDGEANDAIPEFDKFLVQLRVLKDAYQRRRASPPSEPAAKGASKDAAAPVSAPARKRPSRAKPSARKAAPPQVPPGA